MATKATTAETLANIYDDVEALTARVAALETQLAGMQVQTLAEGADLNTLTVGDYYVPTTTIAATIVNKPALANTATSYVETIEGGGDGQLMQYYRPCAKEGASYYQRSYYGGTWGSWNEVNNFDSGWLDLSLSGDVIAFNDEQKPRYRRIGKEVFISGVIKNVSANETLVATLPVNYRPSKKIIVAVPSTGTKFSRISVHTNGNIYYEQSNDNTVAASNWHSLACNFEVD